METNLQSRIMLWGIYPWLPERGIERIHPDSQPRVLEESPFGAVFKLLDAAEGRWGQIEGARGRLKVDPALFLAGPWPKFDFGEEVRMRPPRSPKQGRIADIRRHDKEKRIFFQASSNRRHPRRHGTVLRL